MITGPCILDSIDVGGGAVYARLTSGGEGDICCFYNVSNGLGTTSGPVTIAVPTSPNICSSPGGGGEE